MMKRNTKPIFNPSPERVNEVVRYEPETGRLFWRVSLNWSIKAGDLAGSYRKNNGYGSIAIDGFNHQTSRIAFVCVMKRWPQELIDHKDGNKSNDKWENLREATRVQNNANSRLRKDNGLQMKGVNLVIGPRSGRRYVAHIRVNKVLLNLGTYGTAEEAHRAYKAAAIKYRGDFARWR